MKNHEKQCKSTLKRVIREERAGKEIKKVNGTNNRSLYYNVEYEDICRTMNSFISNNSSYYGVEWPCSTYFEY